jgi:hypothetical protein
MALIAGNSAAGNRLWMVQRSVEKLLKSKAICVVQEIVCTAALKKHRVREIPQIVSIQVICLNHHFLHIFAVFADVQHNALRRRGPPLHTFLALSLVAVHKQ